MDELVHQAQQGVESLGPCAGCEERAQREQGAATLQMDLEDTMLSEISQAKGQKLPHSTFMGCLE
jgi:hypothetical protein